MLWGTKIVLLLCIIGAASCATTSMPQEPAPSSVSLQELTHGVGGPSLYIFAHQDDELLALHKVILDLRAGISVHVVWITDGGKSADPALRQQESRKVMQMAGVPDPNLHFLGFPDAESYRHMRAAYEQVVAIDASNHFAQVVSPAYEGGNIDHDVAAFVAGQIAAHSPSIRLHLEYPLYNRYHGHRRVGVFLPSLQTDPHYITLDEETRSKVRHAIALYRSERLPLFLMGLAADKQALLDHGAPYRRAPAYDFMHRPSHEPCDYEKSWFHHARFQTWQKAIVDFSAGSLRSEPGSEVKPVTGTVSGENVMGGRGKAQGLMSNDGCNPTRKEEGSPPLNP